jgi:hypothetical protein
MRINTKLVINLVPEADRFPDRVPPVKGKVTTIVYPTQLLLDDVTIFVFKIYKALYKSPQYQS